MACATPTTTTTTQHWQLEKYSRSRAPVEPPAKRSKLDGGGRAEKSESGDKEDGVEWDHYTQPQLSLKLQTTFSASSSSSSSISSLQHVQSMLLSISFDPLFRDPHRANQHLTLDLLDLASFSSPAVQAATPKDQLPLKAVYKDAVLGLRYISLEGGAVGQFKRLQVKFVSQEERERFVAAVGSFVPSKPAVEPGAKPVKPKLKPSSKTATPSRKRAADQQQQQLPSQAFPSISQATMQQLYSTSAAAASPAGGLHAPSPHAHPPSSTQFSRPPTALQASTSDQRLPSHHVPLPMPTDVRSSSTTPHPLLPPRLATLLPILSSSSQVMPLEPALTASQQLAQLSTVELGALLQEALLEEGFEDLVAAVQGVLTG
ncbi:hypothetical protein JCM11251_003271 [Rhodosporidiobolus azoricus]